jgi:hypothetical protein
LSAIPIAAAATDIAYAPTVGHIQFIMWGQRPLARMTNGDKHLLPNA